MNLETKSALIIFNIVALLSCNCSAVIKNKDALLGHRHQLQNNSHVTNILTQRYLTPLNFQYLRAKKSNENETRDISIVTRSSRSVPVDSIDKLDTKIKKCTEMEKASKIADRISNGLGKISSATSGILSYLIQAVAAVSTAYKSYTHMKQSEEGCDDIPFDEIKLILDNKFRITDYAVDRNYGALKEVSKVVDKILDTVEAVRAEMNQQFNYAIQGIDDIKAEFKKKPLQNIVHFIENFEIESFKIENALQNKDFNNIERVETTLRKLRGEESSSAKKLLTYLNDIVDNQYDIPQKNNDEVALACLNILHAGIVIYHKILLFLINHNSFIANFYYEQNIIEKFNKYHGYIYNDFDSLQHHITSDKTSITTKVINHFEIVQNSKFVKDNVALVKMLSNQKQSLIKIKRIVEQIDLPILDVEPATIYNIRFDNTHQKQPFGQWKSSTNVRYALQYKQGKLYSKIGAWSKSVPINNRAYPTITLPPSKNVTVLLFRKFDNNIPEFVGTAKGGKFIDIDRDLYNEILDDNEDEAIGTVTTLKQYGARIDAAFDNGRRAIHLAAKYNRIRLAERNLIHNVADIDVRDNDGFTPIHIAFNAKHYDFLNMLLARGADINAQNTEGLTLLHMVTNAQNVSLIRILEKIPKLDVNAKDRNGYTSLHKAVYTNVEIVQALLSHRDIDVNVKNKDHLTPLHLAVVERKKSIIDELLKREDLEINASNKGNLTALHIATMAGSTEIVKALIKHKDIDINVKAIDGRTALHYAIVLKKIDIVSLLLSDSRVNVNVGAEGNITPLHSAIMTGQDNVAFVLLQKSANALEATEDGFTALHFACLYSHDNLTNLLLIEPNINVDVRTKDGLTPLHFAVTHLKLDTIKHFITWARANVKVTDISGKSLLHEAAAQGKLSVIKYLVEDQHLDFTTLDRFDRSPAEIALLHDQLEVVNYFVTKSNNCINLSLHDAIVNDNLHIVKYLVAYELIDIPDLDKQNIFGQTPLFDAVKYGRLNIVKYMIDGGANFNIKDYRDQHLVHIAAEYGHLNLVKYFVEEKECDVNMKSWSKTTLHYAAESGNLDLMTYLIEEKGCNPRVTDEQGFTPLHYAVCGALSEFEIEGSLAVVKYLVEEKKVDPSVMDPLGRTALYVAAQYGNLDALIYLSSLNVKFGIIVNTNKTTFQEGNTLLMAAAANGHLSTVKWLVETLKKKIDVVNFNNNTALHLAARNNRFDVVKYLTEKGANVNAVGKDGNTPLHEAVYSSLYVVEHLVLKNASPLIRNKFQQTPLDLAMQFESYRLIAEIRDIIKYLKTVTI